MSISLLYKRIDKQLIDTTNKRASLERLFNSNDAELLHVAQNAQRLGMLFAKAGQSRRPIDEAFEITAEALDTIIIPKLEQDLKIWPRSAATLNYVKDLRDLFDFENYALVCLCSQKEEHAS